MDFFEQQDRARKKTGTLVALFVGAVLAISLLVWGLVVVVFFVGGNSEQARGALGGGVSVSGFPWWQSFLGTLVGVTALVGGGSLTKIAQLRGGGGKVVAESLGGTLLSPDTRDPDARKVLNVVEEMAIASGMPVPPVYLMGDERGINAFAAGYRPENAVIGVTRGCIENLTRDELQGVMAHEFSHILNGDMRINIKLMGTIFGILILTIIGRTLMRGAFYAGGARSSRDSGGGKIAILLVGLGLLAIGFVGVIFGRLIQAAITRQREFLADASAVQFTRNPDSIAGALKRIGGAVYGVETEKVGGPRGTELRSAHAEETAHLFFCNAVSSLSGMFATHPPLDERIRRIEPRWDGKFLPPLGMATLPVNPVAEAGGSGGAGEQQGLEDIPVLGRLPGLPGVEGGGLASGLVGGGGRDLSRPASGVAASIGTLNEDHVEHARRLIGQLPAEVLEAARHPTGCRSLVYALLLDRDVSVQREQLATIGRRGTAGAARGGRRWRTRCWGCRGSCVCRRWTWRFRRCRRWRCRSTGSFRRFWRS